jgi:4-hydroxymandelate synthase
MTTQPFAGLRVDHIHFYVKDIVAATDWLTGGYGFTVYATADKQDGAPAFRSVGLGKERIRLVLTQADSSGHPAAEYTEKHGDGVADIALGVADAAAAFEAAVRRGAKPVSPPTRHGEITTAAILGFGDTVHTFIQRPAGADERALPSLVPVAGDEPGPDAGLREVDHFAVCVHDGQLDRTVQFYADVLDFRLLFGERIVVGDQAITTKAVQSASGAVTLTLIEPDTSRAPGHVDGFMASHGGAGVQHIAFTTEDIVRTISSLESRGTEFLHTPASYYGLLIERIHLSRHSADALQAHNILVDEDHYGQLFQIFSKSVHPRETFFFEIIERFGARTFGNGNIKALYEAVELQRSRDGAAV